MKMLRFCCVFFAFTSFSNLFLLVSGQSQFKYEQLPKPVSSNSQSGFVELLILVDEKLLNQNSFENVQTQNRLLAAQLNHVMQPMNVFVYLRGQYFVDGSNTINITTADNASSALSKFSHYIVKSQSEFGVFDHAMLITPRKFDSEYYDVQLSFLGGICWLDSSESIVTTESLEGDQTKLVSAMAYALARNLGIENDHEDRVNHGCRCQKRPCIMNSYKRRSSFVEWSSCSRDYLQRAKLAGRHYCLQNLPQIAAKSSFRNDREKQSASNSSFSHNQTRLEENDRKTAISIKFDAESSSRCGNGFLEPGEQCDCGLPEFCSELEKKCCNPQTCQLRENSTCASGDCCDLKTCQLKKQGDICRSPTNQCDLPEYCSGISEQCPRDIFKHSGHECPGGKCWKGKCQSLNLQCQAIFGETASAAAPGFWFSNMPPLKSADYGCGSGGIPCANDSDVECGRLFCQHEAEKPYLFFAPPHWKVQNSQSSLENNDSSSQNASLSLFTTHRTESRSGNRIVREAAYVVINAMPGSKDPGLVEDGTPCGAVVGKNEGICVNHVCVFDNIEDKCESEKTCSGHGVCNSVGSCHCDPGFAPPYCLEPGMGGSNHSGYPNADSMIARQSRSNYAIVIGASVFALGVLIAVAAVVAFIFRRKLQIWYYAYFRCFSTSRRNRVPSVLRRDGILRSSLAKAQRKLGNSMPSESNYGSQGLKQKLDDQCRLQSRQSFRGLGISTPVLKHSTRRDLDTLMPLATTIEIESLPMTEHYNENSSTAESSERTVETTSPMLSSGAEDQSMPSPDLIQSTYSPNCSPESANQKQRSLPKRPAPKTPLHQNRPMLLKVSCSDSYPRQQTGDSTLKADDV